MNKKQTRNSKKNHHSKANILNNAIEYKGESTIRCGEMGGGARTRWSTSSTSRANPVCLALFTTHYLQN